MLGDGEIVSEIAAIAARRSVETVLGGGELSTGVVGTGGGGCVGVAVGGGRGSDVLEGASGVGAVVDQQLALCGPRNLSFLGDGEVVPSVVEERREPVRDDAPWSRQPCGYRAFMLTELCGEGAALGDGGNVGTVDGDDAVEDVAGFGNVIAVGDHADHVLVAAAGDGDV